MSLKKELENLFVDRDMNEEMMYEYCQYDEDLARAGIDYKQVDHYGGEGQGEEYWTVWQFSRDGETVLVKFEGWYASYHGADFTEWKFVEPKQVMVTQYV
jgi:hypothetical protein